MHRYFAIEVVQKRGASLLLETRRHMSSRCISSSTTVPVVSASLVEFGFSSIFFTNAELKGRYRELAQQHHPDCGGCDDRMRRIVAAYEVLSSMSDRDKEQYAVQRKFYRGDRVFSDFTSWTQSTTQRKSSAAPFASHHRRPETRASDTVLWLFGTTLTMSAVVLLAVRSAWANAVQIQNHITQQTGAPESQLLLLHRRRRELNDQIHTAKMDVLYGSWSGGGPDGKQRAQDRLQRLVTQRALVNEEIERCVFSAKRREAAPSST